MSTASKSTASPSNKPKAAYLVQRESRKRFSFGKVWENAVLSGEVNDKDKLVAHGVKLKVGQRGSLAKLRFETLLTKVQSALSSASK